LEDASEGADAEEHIAKIIRLEQKVASLDIIVEEQCNGNKKLNTEVSIADCLSGLVCWVVFHLGLLMDSWWFWVRLQGGGSNGRREVGCIEEG
jgi:hypothetical protein